MERMIFTSVNLGENLMKGSLDSLLEFPFPCSPSSSFPLHHLVLLSNAKWVKAGIKTTEGCAIIVLKMSLCQQEARPRRRPGKNIVAKMVAITGTVCSSLKRQYQNGEASATPFPTRERRHAAKRSRNLKMEE